MNETHPIFKLFCEKGEKRILPANTSLSLQDEESVWFLEKGAVNLFAIELQNEEAVGQRTFLSHCTTDSLFFNIDKQCTYPVLAVYAISESEITIWKLSAALLEEAIETDATLSPLFANYLEDWIHHIAQYAEKADIEKHDHFITPSKELSIEEEKTFSVKRALDPDEKKGIVWVEIKEGKASFQGNLAITIDPSAPFFPLTYHLWLQALETTSIQTYSTDFMLENRRWHAGLALFHKTLFHHYLSFRKEKKEKLVNKLKDKIEEDEETLHKVFKEMVTLLNPEAVTPITASKAPLFQACLFLGKLMKLNFILPEEPITEREVSLQISAICNASGIRHRQVRLTKEWWKQDSGTMLAFFGANQEPVVLRRKRGFYEMIDVQTKKKKIVSKEVSKELLKLAYTFYRPFPSELKRAKEAILFYLQTNFKELIPVIFFGSIGSLISLFVPFATANIFSRAIPDSDPSILIQLCLGLLLAAFSTSIFFYLRTMGLVRMSGHASNSLQAALWDRLLKLPVSFFRKFTTGNLVQKVSSVEQIREILSDNSSRIILAGIFSFFYLIAMFFYSPILTLLSILLMGFGLVITSICFYYKLRFERKIQNLTSNINGVLVQIISGVGKLRVAGAENNAFSYWARLFTNLKRHELNAQVIHNIVLSMISFLPIFSYAIIFGTVMVLKETGNISLGAFLGFNAAFMIFSVSLLDVSSAMMNMVAIPPLWNNVRTVLDAPQERIVEKVKIGRLTGDISIDEVSFRYEKGGPLVLDTVSLYVEPKEFIAIVGPSGSGKSTLVRLLLGFETPDLGTIYYEGKELTSLNLHEVRRQIGVVIQGSGVISGSIYDNLVCGGIYSKRQIDEALALSGFIQDLHTFPMGLHTFIHMGGETLSGGQKQRLLIARALLPQPKILIFDEATSALDNKVQDKISRNLDAIDVTRIVIAHRLSTIKYADRIYVLDKGRIIQTGTFEELTHKPGLFNDMLKRQKL